MKTCAKCTDSTEQGKLFVSGGQTYAFCKFCTMLLEKIDKTHMIHLFLQPNSSSFKELGLTEEESNMLAARERRASGDSPWSKKK